jgi:hypothetical protein
LTGFAVVTFLVAAVMITTSSVAQNVIEFDRQRAARQAQAEWRRVLPAEIACIDQRLRRKASSIEALVRRGVKPSAAWLIELRSSCREFVGGVQTDAAPALSGDATGSPAPTVSQGNLNEDVGLTPSTESMKESGVTPPSSEKSGQVAEEQMQQGNVEPKNGVQRGNMEWLSAAFLFALVSIAVLLGIVLCLFIGWHSTGRGTYAVSLPENDSPVANTPSETTIGDGSKVGRPLPDEGIQERSQMERSVEASMSQDPAHRSNSQPTYGELFPEIVSMKPRN